MLLNREDKIPLNEKVDSPSTDQRKMFIRVMVGWTSFRIITLRYRTVLVRYWKFFYVLFGYRHGNVQYVGSTVLDGTTINFGSQINRIFLISSKKSVSSSKKRKIHTCIQDTSYHNYSKRFQWIFLEWTSYQNLMFIFNFVQTLINNIMFSIYFLVNLCNFNCCHNYSHFY